MVFIHPVPPQSFSQHQAEHQARHVVRWQTGSRSWRGCGVRGLGCRNPPQFFVPRKRKGGTPLLSNGLWVRHFHLCCSSRPSSNWGQHWPIWGWATGRLVYWGQVKRFYKPAENSHVSWQSRKVSQSLSSGGKSPELGVRHSVALTRTFMTLGNIKIH